MEGSETESKTSLFLVMQVNRFLSIRLMLLLLLPAARLVAAGVTWDTIGCTGWTYLGATADEIWDNAVELSDDAVQQVQQVLVDARHKSTKRSTAIANNDAVWNVKAATPSRGVVGVSQSTAINVQSYYFKIGSALQRSFSANGNGLHYAFFFCSDRGLKYGNPINNPFPGKNVYYQTFKRSKGVREDVFISPFPDDEYVPGHYHRPCRNSYPQRLGVTFKVLVVTAAGKAYDGYGVLLCEASKYTHATLPRGYAPSRGAHPDDYVAVSGSLVHEMRHVVGRIENKRAPDTTGKFQGCYDYARSNPGDVANIPDCYRVFGQMARSPRTFWRIT